MIKYILHGGNTFEKNNDNEKIKVLNDIALDHIMVTAKDKAANPRTRFVQAILKSMDKIVPFQEINTL